MPTSLITPKVFISYSWKPASNKEKVLKLAERLSLDGVHVIIDDWNLTEGQDKYLFMEQMVNNSEVKRVLLICNKDYADKANSKKGGVGIESLIISDDIYSKAEQTKFIPVIFEYDLQGKAYTPTFVNGRIYIDLSNDEIMEGNYELLLRNIFEKPTSKRPPLGTPPAYIQNEDPIFLPTAHKIGTIKNAFINEKKNTNVFIQDYLDTFISSLDLFAIGKNELNSKNVDDIILNKIENLSALMHDFIRFLEILLTYSVDDESERMHRFFERLLEYLFNSEYFNYPKDTLGYFQLDHYKFFYYELFLTYTSIMIEKERFKELAYTLHNVYLVSKADKITDLPFNSLKNFVSSLNEHRNARYKLNRASFTADLIKQRAKSEMFFQRLKEADILLYYISLLIPQKYAGYRFWFPETSCYNIFGISILPRTISQKYFDKIKILFDVNDLEELKIKITKLPDQTNSFFHPFAVLEIKQGLRLKEMCSFK